jgi:hypothetical protein
MIGRVFFLCKGFEKGPVLQAGDRRHISDTYWKRKHGPRMGEPSANKGESGICRQGTHNAAVRGLGFIKELSFLHATTRTANKERLLNHGLIGLGLSDTALGLVSRLLLF